MSCTVVLGNHPCSVRGLEGLFNQCEKTFGNANYPLCTLQQMLGHKDGMMMLGKNQPMCYLCEEAGTAQSIVSTSTVAPWVRRLNLHNTYNYY